jgi:hypothetical protein
MKTNIELSYKEKEDLRKLYAKFQNINSEKAISDYEINFPNLKKAGINIQDLPKLIYTKNQLLFIEDAEDAGLEIKYGYSGRGMFGDVCPAVHCDSHNDITTKAKTCIDGMGLGIVIYAQNKY